MLMDVKYLKAQSPAVGVERNFGKGNPSSSVILRLSKLRGPLPMTLVPRVINHFCVAHVIIILEGGPVDTPATDGGGNKQKQASEKVEMDLLPLEGFPGVLRNRSKTGKQLPRVEMTGENFWRRPGPTQSCRTIEEAENKKNNSEKKTESSKQ
ncbi:hypothetical protein TNCV_2109971 [Trichonephila clavipes]|nr:hypothetical protein TNCV_2109971 [Trichonephila clavipes]